MLNSFLSAETVEYRLGLACLMDSEHVLLSAVKSFLRGAQNALVSGAKKAGAWNLRQKCGAQSLVFHRAHPKSRSLVILLFEPIY